MRRAGLLIILLFLSSFCICLYSQNGKQPDSLLARADSFYNAKAYDSALVCYRTFIKWFKDHPADHYQLIQSSWAMLKAGICYRKKNDVEHAHQFMTYSLLQARANKIKQDIENALVELNDLHRYISLNNISFPYPAVPTTEEADMFFPISKVEKLSQDSIRITIRAGRYDGITDSVIRGGIISKYSDKEPDRPFGLVNCYIRSLSDNFCTAIATNDTSLQVREGDLVELKTRVPLYWRKLDVNTALLRAIYFCDNYKQPIFNPRYLYYYADSLSNTEIAEIMKNQLDDIVSTMGEDTATSEKLRVKGDKGIFAGENVIKALSHSTGEQLRLFMGFVNEYPRKYIGTLFRLSEVYATWVISNTPLAIKDVKSYLMSRPSSAERQRMAFNLSEDIRKHELTDRWFNEGMLMANADNLDSAQYMSQLIRDATAALADKASEGWSDYLSGFIEKKLSNPERADSLFKKALEKFRSTGNHEGENWAGSAAAGLKKSQAISVSVQSGHLFPYLLAPSPNSRYMATAGIYDKFIKVWDMMLGREIITFTAHADEIHSLHYSPNGRYLVSASDDSTIKIWNAYDYSLIRTIRTLQPEKAVIFTPDSRQLVAGGKDSLLKFIDISTGRVTRTLALHKGTITGLVFLPGNDQYLFSCASDSMVYKWDLETGEMVHWYHEKGKVQAVSITQDGKYMFSLSSDAMMNVWDLDNRKFYFKTKVYTSTRLGDSSFALPAFSPDSKLVAYALGPDSLAIVYLPTLKQINYGTRSDDYSLSNLAFSADGNYLAARLDLGGPLRLYNMDAWDFFGNSKILAYKDIKTYYSLPLSIQFTHDDNELVVVHDAISKIDLRNGKTSLLYYGALFFQNNYVLLNKENLGIYAGTERSSIEFFDHVKKKFVEKFSLPDSAEKLTRFELSGDNHYLFLAGDNNTIVAYELPTHKLLFSKIYSSTLEDGYAALRYDSIRQRLYAVGIAGKVYVIDARDGKLLDSIRANDPQTVEYSPAYLYLTCRNSEVYKYDARTLQLLKKIKVDDSGETCYGSAMSGNYKYLAVQLGNKLACIDTKTDQVIYEKYDHDYENGLMTISHNNRILATGGFDCKVNLYDLATGNKIVSIYTPRQKDFMITDPEGHYLAPKNTLDAVSFNYNNNSYGFEQFDTRFNRPDLVLKRIGRADSNLVGTYYAAYKKRLKRLNISETLQDNDVHLPVVRLKDKYSIRPATSLSEYDLPIECFDAKYPLQSLQVLVNNCPLFGTAGKPIPPNANRYELTVKLPLSMGLNYVKVYCSNTKGATSLAESIEISSSYQPATAPKTYFIGIAVSHYKDSSMNLRYTVKDVRDLATLFGKLFKNYEADTLIDAKATKENILKLREKLLQTTVNDKVIISVNGHGLLSDSMDFYYATYDMNFKKPAARGLKYEDLEALLDGIPARKKLMLIDACHSGALDKEELIAAQKKDTAAGRDTSSETGIVKGFASRGMIGRTTKAKVDANSTYEVMQNLFTDLSAGNGAVIISAAGGMEYAFESDAWNNGVFTYCIRRAIEDEKADRDGGNENNLVEVGELKDYVSRKVSELTNGKQKPVSRRENIEFNWVIW